MSEWIYNVRLTEEVREICLDRSEDWVQLPSSLQKAIESTRPENLGRQEALEELAELALLVSYAVNDPHDETQRRFREAADKFRSLEAK